MGPVPGGNGSAEDREGPSPANLVIAEMDPSRIDVARRALSYEVIPRFSAQPGARCGHWMVHRTTGELLVLTTWDDASSMVAGTDADRNLPAELTERTGLWVRSRDAMEVLGSVAPAATGAAGAQWVLAEWFPATTSGSEPSSPLLEGQPLEARGSYWLGDPVTGARLALSFWSVPVPRATNAPIGDRAVVYESIGTAVPPGIDPSATRR